MFLDKTECKKIKWVMTLIFFRNTLHMFYLPARLVKTIKDQIVRVYLILNLDRSRLAQLYRS